MAMPILLEWPFFLAYRKSRGIVSVKKSKILGLDEDTKILFTFRTIMEN
jgi:hypothetical protein